MDASRRELLIGAAGLGLLGAPGWAWAGTGGDARLVLLVLRGALDGLAAVPPCGDRDHGVRGARAVPDPGASGGALDLDGFFGLHPALAAVHPWFAEGDLAVVHAVGLPYRGRSHFDAQNVLETGMDRPFAADSGWLNRAVSALGWDGAPPMAMSRTVPLVLRGPAAVTAADPLREALPRADLLDRIADLYATDPYLGPALEAALGTQAMLDAHRGEPVGRRAGLGEGARRMGALLAAPDGPRIAFAEAGGWDTHTNQEGGLQRLLGGLGDALVGLRSGLGEAWDRTAVVVVSEFGRTVRPNGSGGTDHGTGGVALLAGGAVRGGRVLGDWPGLGREALLEGRDLTPTTDLRALFKGVLIGHLGLDPDAVEDVVFPGSRAILPLSVG